jgi:RNA polymerase sigma-70 factor (ECF subfamily)
MRDAGVYNSWRLGLPESVDEILIEKTLAGSLECYDVLMQRYQKDVFAVARGYTRSVDDSLDVCQNVFLKAYRKLDTFAGRSSFKTWLVSIANREGLNWVRTRSRKTPANVVDLETVSLPSGNDLETELLETERRQKVVDGLQVLNQRSRLAVILRYFRDMSIGEIAVILGCSEGVTRNLLFRSVHKLRETVMAE